MLCYNFFYADVAQLVEQLIRNEKVDSSIPFIGTKDQKGRKQNMLYDPSSTKNWLIQSSHRFYFI